MGIDVKIELNTDNYVRSMRRANGAIWDAMMRLCYAEDLCESHGEVEDVFV
jgi:hypothetical protein